jgi:HTH-type transcriptional regulator/antitoxin HipB
MNLIYGLRDPMTDDYMYVGKSTNGIDRAKSHLKYSHNILVREWVVSLIIHEQEPIVDVLEHCEDPLMLSDKEKYWINKLLSEKHPLLNIITYDITVVDKAIELKRLKDELQSKINYLKSDLECEINGLKFKITNAKSKTSEDIAGMIWNRRKAAGLSRIELSEIAGVGKTVIYDIEHGKKTVKMDTLQKVMKVLNIKSIFYFGETVQE